MNQMQRLLRRIAGLLNDREQPWALVGGLAVSVRTEPRFTRDVDLVVAVSDDKSAENLVHSLHAAGFRTMATVEQEATHRLSTVRMVPFDDTSSRLMLDLLFASSGIEAEICADAEDLQVFHQVFIPVARLYHLIALKVLARDDRNRPQDAADLRQLIAVAQESDLSAAYDAVRIIEKRGFNRSRNLVEAVKTTWEEFR